MCNVEKALRQNNHGHEKNGLCFVFIDSIISLDIDFYFLRESHIEAYTLAVIIHIDSYMLRFYQL